MRILPHLLASAVLLAGAALLTTAGAWAADDKKKDQPVTMPEDFKHSVMGLFARDREADLREAFQDIPELKLVSIDFDQAEITLRYDHHKLFKGVKPEEVIKRLDSLVRHASKHTFGIKPPRSMPLDQCTLVEIEVVGLDCKGCGYAAYQAVARIEGVERATASFKEGKVACQIDPAKTNRAALEAALKQRSVTLKSDVKP